MPQLHQNIDQVYAEQEIRKVLDNSKKRKYSEISQADDKKCMLCHKTKENEIERFPELLCGHKEFCGVCLSRWWETKKNCPLCRSEQIIFKKRKLNPESEQALKAEEDA
jgi:hypothetical protein